MVRKEPRRQRVMRMWGTITFSAFVVSQRHVHQRSARRGFLLPVPGMLVGIFVLVFVFFAVAENAVFDVLAFQRGVVILGLGLVHATGMTAVFADLHTRNA